MSHFSKTQYNNISSSYDNINDLPISRAIVPNVERLVHPYIKGARVLELACGTGFFTKYMLDWGASSIVGVDVSQGMVDAAESELQKRNEYAGKYRFMVADCSVPFSIADPESKDGEGAFDIVFAAWLLNYAQDLPTMTEMFKNISKHLKPGGRFVSVLPHPEKDPMNCINAVNEQSKQGYGYRIEVQRPIEGIQNGYQVQLYFDTDPPVDFGNYYLPMTVHEQAARDGGMKGKLRWPEVTLPEDQDVLNRYMVDPIPKGHMDEWLKYPDFGFLVVEKQ